MDLQSASTRQASGAADTSLPHTLPVIDALPIDDEDSISECPQVPRPWPQSRHQNQRGVLLMELLSRRMSRQSLMQPQHQSSDSKESSTAHRRAKPSSCPVVSAIPDNAAPSIEVGSQAYIPMEIDTNEKYDVEGPTATPFSTLPKTQHRPAPIPPRPRIDASLTTNVTANHGDIAAPTQSLSAASTSPGLTPAIEVDTTDHLAIGLEVDEGYDEMDDYAFLIKKRPLLSELPGATRLHGILRYTTSSEAALRCPTLVRNVPRMRKRNKKKKEHRLRNANEGSGEASQHLP